VACLGVCLINFRLPNNGAEKAVGYDFTEWIARIEKKCPQNVSVADLTSILEKESRVTFNDMQLDSFIAEGAFDGQYPQKSFADFVIAGYDARVPAINRVKFEIDWNERSLNLRIENDHPRAGTRVDFDFFILGEFVTMVNDVRNRESESYKELFSLVPKVLPKLAAMQNLSSDEARSLCLAVLRIQAKHLKSVGPPYSITTTVPLGTGKPTQVIYPK